MSPQVTIQQGKLRGSVATDIQGDEYFKFQGIPYAKPPLGELRFKAPQPPEKWTGVLDATKERDVCYCRDPFMKGETPGSEDCLFLNVYTRKLPGEDGDKLKPVLFWIHGGGLVFGSSSEAHYGPDFLIIEDVVVVTINYRLGLLGFIGFEDPALDIPGNAGFKDQIMALKWVQKNIKAFGGDPNNVTIFGESAGAVSVHLIMLSPLGEGLFHRAIAQSGTAFISLSEGSRYTKELAREMNLEGQDERTVYKALKEKPVEEILAMQEKLSTDPAAEKRPHIGLIIEKNSKEPFLDKNIFEIIKSGKFNQVPFMIGYNTSEGMLSELLKSPANAIMETYIPWYFGYQVGSPEIKTTAAKIKKFYFGDKEYSETAISKRYDLFSDSWFLCGIYLTLVLQSSISKSSTYLYRMSVESDLNYFKKMLKIEHPGVAHVDDIGYLFKNITTPKIIEPGSLEDISFRRFVKLWTNFAKFGNPTPLLKDFEDGDDILSGIVWKPVTGPNLDFLDIGEDLVPLTNPDPERINFWKSLFAESPNGQYLN